MDPGPLISVSRLEGPDFVVTPQGQQDLVETFQQPGTPARIDLEMMSLAGR